MRGRAIQQLVGSIVIALQLGSAAPVPLLIPVAGAQSTALSPTVRQGVKAWQNEQYSEAITTLRNALKDPALGAHDRVQALATIGQCDVRMGDEAGAMAAFHELLDTDQAWTPDPAVFLEDERAVFEKTRASWTPPPPPHRSWWRNPLVLGIGGVGLGGLAFALAGGGGGSKPAAGAQALPGPPNPPSGN